MGLFWHRVVRPHLTYHPGVWGWHLQSYYSSNVALVVPHREVALLVIGRNMGGVAALNMLTELLRIATDSSVGLVPALCV